MSSRVTTATRARRLLNEATEFSAAVTETALERIQDPATSAEDIVRLTDAVSRSVDAVSSLSYSFERIEARSHRAPRAASNDDSQFSIDESLSDEDE